MDQRKEIIGYVHDVSHVGKGETKNYFDFRLQTESSVIREVCFSPGKKRSFDEAALKKSPVKLKRFMDDKKPDSTDILMKEKVIIEELTEVNFQHRQIVPTDLDISKLNAIAPEQLITLKAKVISLQKPVTVTTHAGTTLTKREGLLIDQQGTIKIVLWEADVTAIEDECTYLFKNFRTKRKKLTGEIYVNPAKGNSTFLPADEFPPETLHPLQSVPAELMTTSFTGEIVGVQKCSLNICCFKCSKAIECNDEAIVTCSSCNMKQKAKSCQKQWYVNAVISDGTKKFTLNFYNEMVNKVLQILDPQKQETHNEELVSDLFFQLPTVTCTFNERSRAVGSIEELPCE